MLFLIISSCGGNKLPYICNIAAERVTVHMSSLFVITQLFIHSLFLCFCGCDNEDWLQKIPHENKLHLKIYEKKLNIMFFTVFLIK